MGYRYNSDSIILFDFISSFSPKGRVLDIGIGCGILSLLIKRDFPQCEVFGVEYQQEMFDFAKENAQKNNLNVNYEKTPLQDFSSEKKFNLIVSNPPFYDSNSSKSSNESLTIARYDGHLSIEEFIKKANSLIATNGEFIFCYEAKRFSQVAETLSKYKFYINTLKFIHSKPEKEAGLVLVRAKKIKSKYLKVLPPLFSTVDGAISSELSLASERAKTRSLT